GLKRPRTRPLAPAVSRQQARVPSADPLLGDDVVDRQTPVALALPALREAALSQELVARHAVALVQMGEQRVQSALHPGVDALPGEHAARDLLLLERRRNRGRVRVGIAPAAERIPGAIEDLVLAAGGR